MVKTVNKLLKCLARNFLKPTRVVYREDGKTSVRFHVDDHDDRYVDVEDSKESDDFVVTCRNFRDVRSVVVGHVLVVKTLRTELAQLGEASKTG